MRADPEIHAMGDKCVSPYLRRRLRSYAEALRDRGQRERREDRASDHTSGGDVPARREPGQDRDDDPEPENRS